MLELKLKALAINHLSDFYRVPVAPQKALHQIFF